MAKILIIEDSLEISDALADSFRKNYHNPEQVFNGNDGLFRALNYQYDLLILDWQLPDISGIEVCREIRRSGGNVPILMLTGKTQLDDKESGLDAGADDYLTKPFEIREVMARVRSLLRRPSTVFENILTQGSISLDRANLVVTKNANWIKLTPGEFALLEFFMKHPGRLFSSDELLNRVWSSEAEVSPDALRQCIKRLRSKIDTPQAKSMINYVPNAGYKFEPD